MKMAALLAGAMLTMATANAWAIPALQLNDGSTTVTISDGSALDINPLAGAVTYLGSVGSWILNVSTGITKPANGSAFVPYMDLNSVNMTSTAPGSLQILFSETGFISNPGVTGVTTAVGGTTQGTFHLKSFYDGGNTLFAETSALADFGPFTPTSFAGSESSSIAEISGLYSLTIDALINHTGSGVTSFDAQMTPVPEPGTMILLGAGFLGLAIYGKRRKNA